MDQPLQSVDQLRITLLTLGLTFGPRLLAAIAILTAGFFVGRWVAGWSGRLLRPIDMEPPVRALLVRCVRLVVFALFLVMALQNLGVDLLPLIAGVGVAGAGIALAMQGVLSNLVAGLSIILAKPFRVGEYIGIVGEEGRVENITLFQTTLSHPDRSIVVIPNRKIAGEILHNYGKIRQVDVRVGVAYDTDLNAALAAIHEVLEANRHVLRDLQPVVGATLLADFSVVLAVRPWVAVADVVNATAQINQAIVESFRARGIAIPLPQREIRMLQA